MQRGDDVLYLVNGLSEIGSQLFNIALLGRNKLVQRRIEEADRDGEPFKRLVNALKIALLHRLKLFKRMLALLRGGGEYHLANRGDAVALKEHMLRAAEAYALRPKLARTARIGRRVGICANLEHAVFIGPGHHALEFTRYRRIGCRYLAVKNLAGGAVKRNPVAFGKCLSAQLELLVLLVHHY